MPCAPAAHELDQQLHCEEDVERLRDRYGLEVCRYGLVVGCYGLVVWPYGLLVLWFSGERGREGIER